MTMDLLTILILLVCVLLVAALHNWSLAHSHKEQVHELTRRLVEAHEELDGFRNRERASYRSNVLEWPVLPNADERQGELPFVVVEDCTAVNTPGTGIEIR